MIYGCETHSFAWTHERSGAQVARGVLSYLWNQGENGICHVANGILEGINSLVQAAKAKAKARGYRSTRNLKAIIYLIAGKLELRLPT